MPNNLSSPDADLQALVALMQEAEGEADPIERDGEEEAIYLAANQIRALLSEAMATCGVNLTQLAQRLRNNRSMPTRFFNSSGDMKLSTAVMIAHALNLEWDFHLHPLGSQHSYCWRPAYPDVLPTHGSAHNVYVDAQSAEKVRPAPSLIAEDTTEAPSRSFQQSFA